MRRLWVREKVCPGGLEDRAQLGGVRRRLGLNVDLEVCFGLIKNLDPLQAAKCLACRHVLVGHRPLEEIDRFIEGNLWNDKLDAAVSRLAY